MNFTVIAPEAAAWDDFVARHPRAHVLQYTQWGTLKSAYGWGVTRIGLTNEEGQLVAGAQILLRRLPLRLGTMGYLPMGPLVTDDAQYPALWQAIRAHLTRYHRTAFLKIEPGIFASHEPLPDWSAWGFAMSQQTVQPPRTVLIDLRGSEDDILKRMNQGTRRKIRQSVGEKSEVRYFEAARDEVAKFTGLMQTTGTRNAFGVHEAGYYTLAYDLFVPHQPHHAALILAEHEGEALAGVFVFAAGKTAWYLYGASSNEKRNLMASYGVQWKAMEWARARGCETYDLWGIPDEDEATLEAQFQERSDGLWGVYGFKRGWGGVVARSVGAWDVVYNPVVYQAYKLALRVREREANSE
jgi:lipid II:glycine glycyltransferase (peptidoglycan interpeptide bridge formation enzyme)